MIQVHSKPLMVSNEANLKLEQETAELIPYKMLPDHLIRPREQLPAVRTNTHPKVAPNGFNGGAWKRPRNTRGGGRRTNRPEANAAKRQSVISTFQPVKSKSRNQVNAGGNITLSTGHGPRRCGGNIERKHKAFAGGKRRDVRTQKKTDERLLNNRQHQL